MSAVSDILFVVSVLREHGITVTFEPGWDTRGNGQWTDGYDGSVIHHTGTPGVSYSNPGPTLRVLRDGRSDLPGPLCNGQGRFDGSVHIIAAHPANHAGASGGPSMGPLPVTRLFNPRVMGWEMDYPGNTPMSREQYRTAQVIALATQRLRGRPTTEWTRAHAETSIEGKWDPGYAPGLTIDMARFRATAANLEEDDDMPYTEAQIEKMVYRAMGSWWTDLSNGMDVTLYHNFNRTMKDHVVSPIRSTIAPLADDEANIVAAVQAQPTGGQVDVDALAARLRGALGDAVADELAQRLTSKENA